MQYEVCSDLISEANAYYIYSPFPALVPLNMGWFVKMSAMQMFHRLEMKPGLLAGVLVIKSNIFLFF